MARRPHTVDHNFDFPSEFTILKSSSSRGICDSGDCNAGFNRLLVPSTLPK
jgi:hypothetical protein